MTRHAGILPFLVAAVLLLLGTTHLPYNLREHDIGSHLVYLRLVKEHHNVPRADACWECHQPPLYYVLAAALLDATKTDLPPEHPKDGVEYPGAHWLQCLGAVCGFGTIAFGLLTVRLLLERSYERFIASAFITFWPTLAIHACRIGNDSLFFLFASASLWGLVSWRRSGRPLALLGAVATACLAANAKVNGTVVLLVVAVCVAAAILWVPRGEARWGRGVIPGAAALVLASAAWWLGVAYWRQGKTSVNFHSMGDNLIVLDTWKQFVSFSTDTFAKDPFAHFGGGSGRDEFWNLLLRTSLFGQWTSENPTTTLLASGLVALMVVFVPSFVAGLVVSVVRGLRRDDGGDRELAITFLGFVAFLVLLRYRYPWAPHNDFRFILPVVVPCSIMAARSLGWLHGKLRRRWPHLAALPGWLVLAFCILSTRIATVWP